MAFHEQAGLNGHHSNSYSNWVSIVSTVVRSTWWGPLESILNCGCESDTVETGDGKHNTYIHNSLWSQLMTSCAVSVALEMGDYIIYKPHTNIHMSLQNLGAVVE